EFLVVCHGSTLADARTLAEDIRLNTEAADFGIGESRTVSIGVAEFIQGDSITTLIERADRGLYLAKESGRNRTCTTPDGPPQ
ncbi:MAG: diguanylate cyclase, partial [Hydrogenophaga sp.]|nr:diguanylate cyclase [Hydrogenophaga sp.]